MRTTSLMVALLVAAALAGCTGGSSNEGQLPDEAPEGGSDGSQTRSNTRGPGDNQGRGDDKTYDAYLEVSPTNGTAPLNVTLTFGATWQDNGQRAGRDGNDTTGNGTGGSSANQTSSGPASNGTGNQTGGSGNQTGGSGTGNQTSGPGNGTAGNATGSDNEPNDGSHPVNGGHDVTWTLEVRLMSSGSTDNGTGNGTAPGSATGNETGNGTSTTNTTSSSQTTTGSAGNETGNGTSSQTNTMTGSAGNGTSSNGTSNGTLVASFNGTGADLPGNETVLLNETGSYTVTFIVTPDDGSSPIVRDANIAVEPLPPGSPLGNETSIFEGSIVAADPLLCTFGSEDFEWVLNATFGGGPADVSHLNVTADVSGVNTFELTLFAPNETEIATGEEIHVEGPFENGTYMLRAESCVSANVDYSITAIAHYTTPGYVPKGTAGAEEDP